MKAAAIAEHTPRETAGSTSFRAFDFQLHFSMSKVLAHYRAGDDFIAFFDHHDDLVFLKINSDCEEISFYQVKSKIGSAWTVKQLSNRPAGGDPPKSILGKSYYNIHQFGPDIQRATLISNQPLNATYACGSKVKADDGEIAFGALCQKDLDAVTTALSADFPSGVHSSYSKLLTYQRTPLDPQSFRKTLLGEVTEFTDKIDPGGSAAPKPVYDALLSEISRCTGDATRPNSLEELKARKALSRTDIDGLVERVQQRTRTVLEWWPIVASELTTAGDGAIKQLRLRLGCLSYWRERQRGSLGTVTFSEALGQHLNANKNLVGDSIKVSVTALVLADAPAAPKGAAYDLEAALIVEIMEREQ